MRQERIRKTPRRRPRTSEPEPLAVSPRPAKDTRSSAAVLQRIAEALEGA